MGRLTILKEDFRLVCDFIYELEHFLPKSTGKILIRP